LVSRGSAPVRTRSLCALLRLPLWLLPFQLGRRLYHHTFLFLCWLNDILALFSKSRINTAFNGCCETTLLKHVMQAVQGAMSSVYSQRLLGAQGRHQPPVHCYEICSFMSDHTVPQYRIKPPTASQEWRHISSLLLPAVQSRPYPDGFGRKYGDSRIPVKRQG